MLPIRASRPMDREKKKEFRASRAAHVDGVRKKNVNGDVEGQHVPSYEKKNH